MIQFMSCQTYVIVDLTTSISQDFFHFLPLAVERQTGKRLDSGRDVTKWTGELPSKSNGPQRSPF